MPIKEIIFPFSVGIAIFFFGLECMRIGLNTIAGKSLETWLARFTKTPLIGFITGTIATSIVQSSSAITVMTVGLVNARLLTYQQSIGIILGTNVGTTVTTQILSLPIDDYALPMFITGVIFFLIPWRSFRFFGLTIGGLSLIMIGLNTIQTISYPIANQPFIQDWFNMIGSHPTFAVLAGAIFTAIIQSSTATTAITMVFVEAGLVPLTGAVAIILGSNIGTCITAYLASLGGSKTGKLVAYAHILLNLFGVILFLPLIKTLTLICLYLADDPGAQVAHAQTIFNLFVSLLVLPFAKQFGNGVERLAYRFS
jgi:phosphate:Na+ symporter